MPCWRTAARTQDASPDYIVRTVGQSIADDIQRHGFRGCAFLNAAAEEPDPEPAARHFVMLRDGAMAAGCLTDPEPVAETFLLGVEGLLAHRARRPDSR